MPCLYFYFRTLSMHEILDILEKEDSHADVYIEPNDPGLLTDEESADEDDSGLIDNLSGRQLAGHAEAIFPNGNRITEHNNEANFSSHTSNYKTPKWVRGTSLRTVDRIFPEANYAKYRDFTPIELFELFFDEEMWNLLVDQTIVYAMYRGETDFLVSKEEIKVFVGILIASSLVPVSSRISWKHKITKEEDVLEKDARKDLRLCVANVMLPFACSVICLFMLKNKNV